MLATDVYLAVERGIMLGSLMEDGLLYKEKFIVRSHEVQCSKTATVQTIASLSQVRLTVTVYLSLWYEAASTFRGLLNAGDRSQSVLLVTSVNPKVFGGNLYLNSTQGTRFFFDTNIPEVAEFVSSVGATAVQGYTCIDTLEGIKKNELVSIGDLNTFISNSNEQRHGTSLNCTRCVTSDLTGVLRFRVELAVDDGKDSVTFVVLDKEMSKLTKQDAAVLALDMVHEGGEERLPGCLEELEGKEFVFQIRVTPFNFTPNHRTFTVSTITEDVTIANHVKEHFEGLPSNSEDNVELAASSSGPPIVGDKISEG
ncbi:Uncharacterized protein Rs2_10600 [Raphanus sativus]|nr:Uncharacterized protein Rs2_10600 [Raphanus sativus]